ncbi:MAG: radical SAM family heme chaperone HemW [Clostridiales bacterium]|nr:radical SAM family heme chaperone HemW [Candidatus Crickella equi]
MDERTTGIYIHIPFCVKKCNYCAFLSAPGDEETREKYVQALIREIGRCKVNFTSCEPISTVYFGGGTPSVLSPEQIGRIMDALRANFTIADDAEITLEANPGTLGAAEEDVKFTLHQYRAVGINRLSMGVQSLNDDVLKFIGRIHTAEDVRRDFKAARASGYDNINLDLILSLPFGNKEGAQGAPLNSISSQEQSLEDLREILAMHPEHISCYSLQIEEGTTFGKLYDQGLLDEITDEEDRDTYHKVCKALRDAGYEHYEISNWAYAGASGSAGLSRSKAGLSRSPYRSRHNSSYWNMSDYIGLGLGASGFVGGVRYQNTSDLQKYIECLNDPGVGITPADIHADVHINTEHDNISEAVFTGLRRREGIRYADAVRYLANRDEADASQDFDATDTSAEARFWHFYADAREEAESFVRSGHLIIDDEGLRLTELGIDISNSIMALFV